jgi:Integrase zinc binding domain/RNase H-like domain found in reverse transcriptase
LRPVGYYSKTFNQAERNYNIHDRELLAMMKGLEYWRHLILSSPHQLMVISDHANLQYYREAHKITRWVVCYLPRMANFNMRIVHRPGKTNKADPLSRPPGVDQGEHDHDNILVLPPKLFVRLLTEHQSLENEVLEEQKKQAALMKQWEETKKICFETHYHIKRWLHRDRLVVPDNLTTKQSVLEMYHDHKTAGHPGITRTLALIAKDYWWPKMAAFMKAYVQGCAVCQSTKSGTTRPKVPLVPIPPKQMHVPFGTIALDLITDLPMSEGYDSILTITDHDCSKAAIFIPCHKSIDSKGIARSYAQHVFPHYGPPKRVISDRDPRFASKWTRELC